MSPASPNNLEDQALDRTRQALYGDAQRSFNWRDRLAEKRQSWQNSLYQRLTHKSLNIPLADQEEMNINSSSRSGLGWKELLVIALALVGGYSAYNYFNRTDPSSSETTPTEEPASPPSSGLSPVQPSSLYNLDIRGQ